MEHGDTDGSGGGGRRGRGRGKRGSNTRNDEIDNAPNPFYQPRLDVPWTPPNFNIDSTGYPSPGWKRIGRIATTNYETIRRNAHEMSVKTYMDWCNEIERVDDLCLLNGFAWPDDAMQDPCIPEHKQRKGPPQPCVVFNGHVRGYKQPGAYIEQYDIIAVNQRTGHMWCVYLGMGSDFGKPILPRRLLEPVCKAANRVCARGRPPPRPSPPLLKPKPQALYVHRDWDFPPLAAPSTKIGL